MCLQLTDFLVVCRPGRKRHLPAVELCGWRDSVPIGRPQGGTLVDSGMQCMLSCCTYIPPNSTCLLLECESLFSGSIAAKPWFRCCESPRLLRRGVRCTTRRRPKLCSAADLGAGAALRRWRCRPESTRRTATQLPPTKCPAARSTRPSRRCTWTCRTICCGWVRARSRAAAGQGPILGPQCHCCFQVHSVRRLGSLVIFKTFFSPSGRPLVMPGLLRISKRLDS